MVATLSPSPPPLDGDSMFLKPVYPFASLSVHLSIFRVSVCLSGWSFLPLRFNWFDFWWWLSNYFSLLTGAEKPYPHARLQVPSKQICRSKYWCTIVNHVYVRSVYFFSSCRMHGKDKDWAKQRKYWKLAPLLDVQLTVMQALLNTVL